jgi:hypothetical protein
VTSLQSVLRAHYFIYNKDKNIEIKPTGDGISSQKRWVEEGEIPGSHGDECLRMLRRVLW